ncbi:MAG TPA: DUF1802 family protein [Pirellulaceae bacterium]|nr:DUF1802 family protein [Pirellulaceae bacterium]
MSSVVSSTATQVAFKEWAVICAALAAGQQTIVLRKGGIHEGRAGFRVAHREFWLLPTHFHASADALVPAAAEFIESEQALPTVTDEAFQIQHYAAVEEVIELREEAAALALAGLHLWSEQTVKSRFAYKQPGLFLLITRIHALPHRLKVLNTPQIAGCRSWVDLPEAIDTLALSPVLSDDAFRAAVEAVHQALR